MRAPLGVCFGESRAQSFGDARKDCRAGTYLIVVIDKVPASQNYIYIDRGIIHIYGKFVLAGRGELDWSFVWNNYEAELLPFNKHEKFD